MCQFPASVQVLQHRPHMTYEWNISGHGNDPNKGGQCLEPSSGPHTFIQSALADARARDIIRDMALDVAAGS